MSNKTDLGSLKDMVSSKLAKNSKKNKKIADNKKNTERSNLKEQGDNKKDILHREALALGATEEEIKLVEDIADEDDDDASEQEFGSVEGEEDEEFKGDLQSFMKTLGFDKQKVDVIEDIEVGEEKTESEENQEEEPDNTDDDAESSLSSDSEEEAESESEELSGPEKQEDKKKPSKEKRDSGFVSQNDTINQDKLLIPFDTVWYDIELDPELKTALRDDNTPIPTDQITKLYERGKEALETDNQSYYDEFTKESSQKKFMSHILTGGTLNDKISALTLLIQESPIHNIKSFETLVSFCNKKSRNSILQSINALKDLFLSGLLPDRKLRYFKNQPGLSMMLSKKTLAIFYFEDFLKKKFFQILQIFEKLSHDPIIHVRLQCLNHIYDLLSAKPEQEFNLLRLLVNKLGDIDVKVSSKASYLLLRLEQTHPNMKSVVIDAIVDVALRPNADYHATYYSVITLNQTILRRADDAVANKLIKTYFTLFEKFLLSTDGDNIDDVKEGEVNKSSVQGYEAKRKKNFKKGKKGGKSVKNEKTESDVVSEKNSKLFSGLLTGVNRAFPYAQLSAKVYEMHLETLFKITHSSNFNTSVQALVLINQVVSKAKLDNDRYYRTLYESLLDQRLLTSSKQGIYLNLLYKSLKQDSKNAARVEAFVKRILQVCSHWLNVGTVAGFFFLLLQLAEFVPPIRNLLTNTPTDDDYQSDNESEVTKKEEYDSRKRDPKFANADKSSLWEITHFLNHFHPTIQTYCQAFMENKKDDVTKPDLGLYSLAHFLDRFVYRNAKQKSTARGASIMQPLYGGAKLESELLVKSTDYVSKEIPANTENWLDKKVDDIKPDEKFFHQYFINKQSAIKKTEKPNATVDSDSELDEDDVWDALVKSRPDVEDDSDDEDGLNFDEEEFEMSSDEEVPQELQEESSSAATDSEDDEFYSFVDDSAELPGKRSLSELDEAASDSDQSNTNSNAASAPENSKKNKRQKMRDLPLYGSVEDYAKYINSDEDV